MSRLDGFTLLVLFSEGCENGDKAVNPYSLYVGHHHLTFIEDQRGLLLSSSSPSIYLSLWSLSCLSASLPSS